MNYQEFLNQKQTIIEPTGFEVDDQYINEKLFPFQRAIVKWALRRGRSAIFADTGLGKSFMQIEWAWQVSQYTGNRVLILAPLCVAEQTVKEADKLGYYVRYERSFGKDKHGKPRDEGSGSIIITNYEMLHEFEDAIKSGYFDGIVLDESSIIKHKDSKTRNFIIETAKHIPYKLSATATPSPNDYMEMGNQAEFLGVMTMAEMLAMYFIHDSGETSKWRLKGHGEAKFWEWLATWAVTIKKPSDLGFSDDGYDLPGLEIEEIVVDSVHSISDNTTLSGRNEARRISIDERVQAAVNIINNDPDQYVVWCNLNDESQKLKDGINGSVEVKGSDKIEHKESRIQSFTEGESRVMVTKPSIAGFGMNWQHCNKMVFVGLNDSFEQLYQAIRRCYRFGQTKVVKVYLISSVLEGAVRDNILEKERKAEAMSKAMIEHMANFTKREVVSLTTEKTDYNPQIEMNIPSFLGASNA